MLSLILWPPRSFRPLSLSTFLVPSALQPPQPPHPPQSFRPSVPSFPSIPSLPSSCPSGLQSLHFFILLSPTQFPLFLSCLRTFTPLFLIPLFLSSHLFLSSCIIFFVPLFSLPCSILLFPQSLHSLIPEPLNPFIPFFPLSPSFPHFLIPIIPSFPNSEFPYPLILSFPSSPQFPNSPNSQFLHPLIPPFPNSLNPRNPAIKLGSLPALCVGTAADFVKKKKIGKIPEKQSRVLFSIKTPWDGS